MQPYLFPYIGYFQLMNAVDKFVIYDDVNFINRGWINRNSILVNGEANLFTIPLKKASQNKLINQIEISDSFDWKEKLLSTLTHNYKKATNFKKVFNLISEIINIDESNISKLIYKSLLSINEYLNVNTTIIETSSVYQNSELKKEERIIDICKKENSEHYINPVGGIVLYSKESFQSQGIDLNFLQPRKIKYKQFNEIFINSLSIIDVLMFNSNPEVKEFLKDYELL